MRKRLAAILVLLPASAMLTAPAWADPADDGGASVLTRPPRGSLAAQLRLKLSLQMAGGTSLAASLDHNRQEWKTLSPDQREEFRREVLAFLKRNPKDQDKLLKSYNTFLELDETKRGAYRRRAQWVKAVVATFTPAERDGLRKMSSIDRARLLIARRDQLVREGKLALDPPGSTPPAKDGGPEPGEIK